MKKQPSSEDSFFDWAYDTRYYQKRNNLIAWALTFLFGLIAVVAVGAVMALAPFKEKVPFVITVDRSTGILDSTTNLTTLNWTRNQAIDFSNVANYIRMRESYIHDAYPDNYNNAVKLSAGAARTELIQRFAPDSIESPLMKYRDKTQINIRFKNDMAFQTENIIIARFIADVITGPEITQVHYVATVSFDYDKTANLSLTTRLTNPLAFVVTQYQLSREGYQDG